MRENTFKNVKTSTGGIGLKLNDFSSSKIECPQSFINTLKDTKNLSREFADNEEYNYFLEFQKKYKLPNTF